MEAAIAWLVQAILATLLIHKLDAWIRRVGLADDVEKLKSGIRRINMVVSAVKERGIRNESLDESLALLKDLLYDADDVVDELDYCRLQELVEGVTRDEPHAMHGAERVDEISKSDADTQTPNSSVGKLRSPVWEHFGITKKVDGKPIKAICIYCRNEFNCETKTNGTSSMKKHLEKEHSITCTKTPGAHPPNHLSAGEPIGSSSRRKGTQRRSKAWDLFYVIQEENEQPIKARCKYCPTVIKCGTKNGTASMLNHNKICNKKPGSDDQPPNPSSNRDATANVTAIVIGESSRKRRREDVQSAQIIAANTNIPWDKATLSNRIRIIASQLQDIQGGVSEVLKLHGSGLASNSNHHQSTTSDQHLRTSSLVPPIVYGRVAEKNSIIKMIEERSAGVVVLPIVGIAGVGKTTLAQLVYNDPDVEHQFDQRIWVWVSHNFDEVRLTREMLDSISPERHEEINCFAKLQEILKSQANSKRILLILDDVWDDMNNIKWDKMLSPLVSSHMKSNVILVTTRNMSVAQRLGTLKPVKLGALAYDDFWLLFRSRAFGYENCEEHQTISRIGRQIAEKLKGNPLAAVSTGELLRRNFSTDYWRNTLKNEDWKSTQLSTGIMASLKLSYDQLPHHLQQCFSYCSIFPDSYQFTGKELIGYWISQGFVKCDNSSQRLEDTGLCYLIDLVNQGFFEVKREESYLGSQVLYAICGLMHDFVMIVSRTDCATIDSLQCNKMPQTLRHLSIVTRSAYKKDQHGNIPRDEKFEENLRNAITSVSELRTLVLLGHYDSFFLLLFQDIFKKAHKLRTLKMSATSYDYLNNRSDEMDGAFPQILSKLYHLHVLDISSYTDPTIPDGINNLVSLRYLVVYKGLCSSIATIDDMASFPGLHGLKFQISSGFEVTQLQPTDEIVQQWMHAKTLEEAYKAVLRNNELSEKLQLSWRDSSADIVMGFESHEPRWDLKNLQISGFNRSSTWLDNYMSISSFQTVHMYDCGEWEMIPSLERFPFLTKLKLDNLPKVIEVLVPSLQELVLVKMPKLQRCLCTSVGVLSSSLRSLQIEDCQALKEFYLFENNNKFEIDQRSWLPGLRKLILCDCPQLEVLKPLPPSTICSDFLISGVSTLPYMERSSSENLGIGRIDEDRCHDFDESCDELRILDDKILMFHNLRDVKSMTILGCRNLMSFSFEGFSHLVSLKSLEITECKELFSSDVTPEYTLEEVRVFPSLESLTINRCGITVKWLNLMLQHALNLEDLSVQEVHEGTTYNFCT